MPEDIPEFLTGALKFGIKPGLQRITRLCEILGDPQDSFKAIHIAGTNGKGSVSAFVSTMLACDDRKVGLFTSPYLERFSERIIRSVNPRLPDLEADSQALQALLESGQYASHHSTAYQEAYKPHYRLIESTIFRERLLPLLK